MYEIYADEMLVYAPTSVSEGYGIIDPKLTLEINKAGSLTFVLPPEHPMYNSLDKLKTTVTVLQDGEQIFRGRVLYTDKDYYTRKQVYCEGEMAFLMDSIVRPYDFQGRPADLLQQMLTEHNNQTRSDRHVTMGTVFVPDGNDYVHFSSTQYPKTWDEFDEKLLKRYGGMVRVRNGVLDYMPDFNEFSDQTIEFGNTLLDISEYISAEDVFTSLIPLGARVSDTSEERLTIKSVNDDLDYLIDYTAVGLFGRITRVNTWDDVTIASNLLTKGQALLNQSVAMATTLTIKAVDLHLLDVHTDALKVGQHVRVLSVPHGIDTDFICSKITLDLVSPDKSEYVLGVGFQGMTDYQVDLMRSQGGIK